MREKQREREGEGDKSNLNQFKSIGFMTINLLTMSFLSATNM